MEGSYPSKLRSACDTCHDLKTKCSGGNPCVGCARSNQVCLYSKPNRLGRPKGSKNRKKSQRDRVKNGSNATFSAERNRLSFVNADKIHGETVTVETLVSEEGILSPMNGTSNDILDKSSLPGVIDDIFSPTCNKDRENVGEMFEDLRDDVELQYNDFNTSAIPMTYESGVHRAMPGLDLSYLQSDTGRFQDPPSTLPDDVHIQLSFGDRLDKNTAYCSCLHDGMELLSTLKKAEGKQSDTHVPLLLRATQESKDQWERLSHCFICQRDQDSAGVLILAMSLRSILHGLQCLLSGQKSSPVGSSLQSVSSSDASSYSVPFDHTALEPVPRQLGSPSLSTIRVGTFEIPHDEQVFVTDVLIARTLGKIRLTHLSMMEYVRQARECIFKSIGAGEKGPVHFVLEDLQRLVMTTEDSIRAVVH